MGGQACDQVPTRVATFVATPTTFTLCSATSNLPPFTATGRDCNKLKSKAPGVIPDLKFMQKREREWYGVIDGHLPPGFLMILVKVQVVSQIGPVEEFSQKLIHLEALFSVCILPCYNPTNPHKKKKNMDTIF